MNKPKRTPAKQVKKPKRTPAKQVKKPKRTAKHVKKPKRTPAKQPRTATKRAERRPERSAAKRPARRSFAKQATKPARRRRPVASGDKWAKFVERHGVVLASARGPVPSVAEAIAGEPIVGSWWSHAKAQAIFDALSSIDDSDEIRCFKLLDHKITFVHRRLWPALARLAHAGVLSPDRVASIQQEHMPTGEHRNFTTPFPDWVPDDVARIAASLSVEDARSQLGSWT